MPLTCSTGAALASKLYSSHTWLISVILPASAVLALDSPDETREAVGV